VLKIIFSGYSVRKHFLKLFLPPGKGVNSTCFYPLSRFPQGGKAGNSAILPCGKAGSRSSSPLGEGREGGLKALIKTFIH